MLPVIIFDADVYLTLAQHPANEGAIKVITANVSGSDSRLQVVVPECVLAAYQREKEHATTRFWATLKTAIKNFRLLSGPLAEPERIASLANELSNRLDTLKENVPATIAEIDRLIEHARVVRHDDYAWAAAARRFRDGKVPGHRSQKSSLTDCLLWQVVVAEAKSQEIIFCTNNKNDFSDPQHQGKLHPDLIAELGAAKYCYHSLDDFLEKHLHRKPGVVTEYSVRCMYCGSFTEPGMIEHFSSYGGWSDQRFCSSCGKYTDLGELPDEG